jgi:arginine-tRNA-protein transferase
MSVIEHPEANAVSLPLLAGPAHPCPYLAGQTAMNEFGVFSRLLPSDYQRLMDAGFRRSGCVVYRPRCAGCHECRPIRVPASAFRTSRSQRRVLRRNADVRVDIGSPASSDEKWRVYSAYLQHQHGGSMSEDRDDFESFLYQSPTSTLEMVYTLGRRVVAVGIVDLCPMSMSSVYFFFDPSEARRSLGVFGALREIEECCRRGLAYWYIGYYIRDCRRMNYKGQFRPCELLGLDGAWRPMAPDERPAAFPTAATPGDSD